MPTPLPLPRFPSSFSPYFAAISFAKTQKLHYLVFFRFSFRMCFCFLLLLFVCVCLSHSISSVISSFFSTSLLFFLAVCVCRACISLFVCLSPLFFFCLRLNLVLKNQSDIKFLPFALFLFVLLRNLFGFAFPLSFFFLLLVARLVCGFVLTAASSIFPVTTQKHVCDCNVCLCSLIPSLFGWLGPRRRLLIVFEEVCELAPLFLFLPVCFFHFCSLSRLVRFELHLVLLHRRVSSRCNVLDRCEMNTGVR